MRSEGSFNDSWIQIWKDQHQKFEREFEIKPKVLINKMNEIEQNFVQNSSKMSGG